MARTYPKFSTLGDELELVFSEQIEHLGRYLNIEAGWDYATEKRVVRVAVAQNNCDWKRRHSFDFRREGVLFTRRFDEEAPDRDLDEHVYEAIAKVKDEIDEAEANCRQTTAEAIEGLLSEKQ